MLHWQWFGMWSQLNPDRGRESRREMGSVNIDVFGVDLNTTEKRNSSEFMTFAWGSR